MHVPYLVIHTKLLYTLHHLPVSKIAKQSSISICVCCRVSWGIKVVNRKSLVERPNQTPCMRQKNKNHQTMQ